MAIDETHSNLFIADYKSVTIKKIPYISSRLRRLSLKNKTVETVLGGPGNLFQTFV